MDIFEEIVKALETEDRVMLATVISTTGSTPAAAHSKMLVKDHGTTVVGSVGGGCMEGDVILQANKLYDSGKAIITTFHLNEDNVEHGLICGGSLDVLIEPITPQDRSLVKNLLSFRNNGNDAVLVTKLFSNHERGQKFFVNPNALDNSLDQYSDSASFDIRGVIENVSRRQQTQRIPVSDGECIFEPIAGRPHVVLFGGGHVAKYVSRIAATAGFRITVIDDRSAFANQQRFPEASETFAMAYAEAFNRISITSSSFLVIVTRGHHHDEEILERAIQTPARYIGMIGSKRKIVTAFEHIIERGGSAEALQRVFSPIGIEIGAVTAEEIAVSVVGELIKVRRGEHLPLRHKSDELKNLVVRLQQPSTVPKITD